jgi:glutamate-5-semialdehyde dehydrogenase
MNELILKGEKAKKASYIMGNISSTVKDQALQSIADALLCNQESILKSNEKDLENARQKGISGALMDRLKLDVKRIEGMAEGVLQIKSLPDPIGEVLAMWKRPNDLTIGKKRVPLGVIGIIYEARPNVTVDAAALCLKAGNAVILRGGSEAIYSNTKIVEIMNKAIIDAGLPEGCIQLIEDTSRETATAMMKLNQYIDVLIPRGGTGLIQSVIANAMIPVIETGVGNCHIYVDGECDKDMAEKIVVNAKTQRPGVCNAAETLLVDRKVAPTFLPRILKTLKGLNVEIRGCQETKAIDPEVKLATDDDWSEEYLDYIIAVKVVDGIDEAISHINSYGTKHSEAIITTNYNKSQRFLQEIDAAAVYVNASTRFTDGYEFGFGAEIGISTQKLHARGPMGLKELTTTKYIIFGDGQIR